MDMATISLSFRVDCSNAETEIYETHFATVGDLPFSLNLGDVFEYVDGGITYKGKVCDKKHRVVSDGGISWELVIVLSESTMDPPAK